MKKSVISRTYKHLAIIILIFFTSISIASETTCRTNNKNINYCKYEGSIETLYINNTNTLIVYFEERINTFHVKEFGFDIDSDRGSALNLTPENNIFFTLVYKTLLEAKTHDREVIIHMRKVDKGFLIIDRLWLK
jgi:hypothetical protein